MSNSKKVLAILAHEINEHDKSQSACVAKGAMHAIRIGQLLIEAKRVVPHGAFSDWVKSNTNVTQRSCQRYMTIARDRKLREAVRSEYDTVSHLTITKAVKLAKLNQTRDELAAAINEDWAETLDAQRAIADHIAAARNQLFEKNDQGLVQWLASDAGFTNGFAQMAPKLLSGEYNEKAWTDALLADAEARLSARGAS